MACCRCTLSTLSLGRIHSTPDQGDELSFKRGIVEYLLHCECQQRFTEKQYQLFQQVEAC